MYKQVAMDDNLMENIEVDIEEPRRDRPARPTYLFSPTDVHGVNRNSLKGSGKSSKGAADRKDDRPAADTDNGIHL